MDGTLLDFLAAKRVAIHACFRAFSLGECTDEMLKHYSGINLKWWKKEEIRQGFFAAGIIRVVQRIVKMCAST